VAARNAARQALGLAVEATLKEPVTNPVTTALGLAKAVAEGDDKAQLLDTLTGFVVGLDRRVEQQDRQIRELNRVVASSSATSVIESNALAKALIDKWGGSGLATGAPRNALALAVGRTSQPQAGTSPTLTFGDFFSNPKDDEKK
jgi:hypothetical protein